MSCLESSLNISQGKCKGSRYTVCTDAPTRLSSGAGKEGFSVHFFGLVAHVHLEFSSTNTGQCVNDGAGTGCGGESLNILVSSHRVTRDNTCTANPAFARLHGEKIWESYEKSNAFSFLAVFASW